MLSKRPRAVSPWSATDSSQDIRELISAAHGAPGTLCAVAARAIGNGWGGWTDAPATPLGREGQPPSRLNRWDQPSADEERFLLDSLSTPDACVREPAIRLLGRERSDEVTAGLVSRLSSADSSIRIVAAFGLGLIQPRSAVDGLIHTVRDVSTGARANSAWALGQIGDETAIPGLRVALTRETEADVRRAEVRALIHSGERSERLTELLQSKDPQVREAAIRGIAGRSSMDPWPWPQPRPRPFP